MLININNRLLINTEQIIKVEKTAEGGCLVYMTDGGSRPPANSPTVASHNNVIMMNAAESKIAWTTLLQIATKNMIGLQR